ncbi:MAG: hypothetical protein WC967_03240 [Balneolaceae bacterium]
MKASTLLATITTLFFVGCVNDASPKIESPLNGKLIQDQKLVSQINASPNTITINEVEYTLESSVWIDLMPSIDPFSDGLYAFSALVRVDGNTKQSDIEIVQYYIVNGKEIWVPDDTEVRQNQSSPNRLEIISREGPAWDRDSKLNIGLKIKIQKTGKLFWLLSPNVPIEETH